MKKEVKEQPKQEPKEDIKKYVTEDQLIDALLNIVTKDQLKALDEKFAIKTHGHSELALKAHTHEEYSEKNHEHTDYIKSTDLVTYCNQHCASKNHSHREYENRGVMPFDVFGIAIFFLGLGAIIAGMVLLWKLGVALLIGGIIVFIIGMVFMGVSGKSDNKDDKKEDDN